MSAAIATLTEMMERLPEPVQERVVDHLREYLLDLEEELKWDMAFRRTESRLEAAARRAKRERAEGKTESMDFSRL